MSYEAWGDNDIDHDPECLALRCPDCGGTDVKAGPFVGIGWCNECEIGADAAAFAPTDCICDELSTSAAAEQAEADAEFIGELNRD